MAWAVVSVGGAVAATLTSARVTSATPYVTYFELKLGYRRRLFSPSSAVLRDTFVGLAAVMSFYFVFRGTFDIAMAFAGSRVPGWWVLLLVGLAEIAIGFWAAGSWKVSVILLVSLVAAGALVHGVGQIASAFLIRKAGRTVAAVDGQRAGASAA